MVYFIWKKIIYNSYKEIDEMKWVMENSNKWQIKMKGKQNQQWHRFIFSKVLRTKISLLYNISIHKVIKIREE